MRRLFVVPLLCVLAAPVAAQDKTEAAPKPAKKVRPNVYDENADGKALVAAACAKAAKENKRVLVQWGGNWCGWCHLLHNFFKKEPEVAKLLRDEYELVLVDVVQFKKDESHWKRLGVDLKGQGFPYLTVVDADGKLVANQPTEPLETPKEKAKTNGYEKPKVVEFLKKYAAPARVAGEVLAAAVARAKSDNKLVFLHFGAPWCGWCHQLEDWAAQPGVAVFLAKDFVDVKIDTDRMTGGKELLGAHRKGEGGIPWFAVLDASGKGVADSGVGRKNIGFPSTDEEIARFAELLTKVKRNLTPEDISAISASLKQWREKTQRRPVSAPARACC
jgi:thiol-disulfide isomerase/thioredoxin